MQNISIYVRYVVFGLSELSYLAMCLLLIRLQGILIICSAVIASVAVWNLSLFPHNCKIHPYENLVGQLESVLCLAPISPLDAYLIFLGAAGLLATFTMQVCQFQGHRPINVFLSPISIFVELVADSKKTITHRLWFECCWTGLFSMMELGNTLLHFGLEVTD
jgi:hypothetical protein